MPSSSPWDADAEETVLGTLLQSRDACAEAVYLLSADDFGDPRHKTVFTAARDLFLDGATVDAVTVADKLTRMGELDDVGGKVFLLGLLEQGTIASSIKTHADVIVRKAQARALHSLLHRSAWELTDKEVEKAATRAEELLYRMKQPQLRHEAKQLGDGIGELLAEIESRAADGTIPGIPSGIQRLDELTGGVRPGQLVIVGARPSMGKTALMVQIALNAAHEDKIVAFFSLEMGEDEVRHRALSQVSNVPLWKFGAGSLTEQEWGRAAQAAGTLTQHLITLDDRSNVTPTEIGIEARRIAAKHGRLDLIVVDYLQLMNAPRKSESRQHEISDISRALKIMARELNVPVLAGAQLSRNLEYRGDKRPVLADLRDSGALEQDADLVLFLYRDEVYEQRQDNDGMAEIILAKHRNGPTGSVQLKFFKEPAYFVQAE